MPKSTAVINPNLGLYLDRAPIAMDGRMLQSGMNFRVREGRLQNLNVGWQRFQSNITLNGPVGLIYDFLLRGGTDHLVFGTLTDLYQYSPSGSGSVAYITPIYSIGTASASGTAVTGSGTLWNSTTPRKPIAGDEISFGNNNVTNPASTWFTIQSVNTDTSITLTASAGVVVNGNYTIRLKFTGQITDLWSADTFLNAAPENEDEAFFTNGRDLPVYWNGSTSQVQILNNNFTAKVVRVYNGMMIYLNVQRAGANKPTSMINSDAAQPKVTNGTGISNEFVVHSDPGEIFAAEKLGQLLAIYSRNVVTVIQFVGDPVQFVFRQIAFSKGALAPKAFTIFPSYHEYLSKDTMYRFDGSTISPINNHVWREALAQVDPIRATRAYTHRDEQTGEIFWVLPSTVDPGSGTVTSPPSQVFVEHYLEDVGSDHPTPFSKRSFPFTATGFYTRQSSLTWDQLVNTWTQYNFRWNDQFFSASFPLNMAGDNSGKLYTFNSAQDADGTALPSFVRFGRRAVIDGRMRGLVSRIYPFAEQFNTPLTITVNFADFAGGPASINAAFTWDQSEPEGLYFQSVFRRGRFVDVQFGTSGPAQPWVLDGFDMDIRPGGTR